MYNLIGSGALTAHDVSKLTAWYCTCLIESHLKSNAPPKAVPDVRAPFYTRNLARFGSWVDVVKRHANLPQARRFRGEEAAFLIVPALPVA
jgi:hypothetical protein